MKKAENLRFLADRIEDGKEFYIDGYLFVYRIGVLMMAFDETEKDSKFMISEMSLDSLMCFDLKLKQQWEFTEDEKVILRNLPEDYQWIARDKNDSRLYVYPLKPFKASRDWISGIGDMTHLKAFNHLFQSIQWSDDEPCEFKNYL